MAKKRRSASKEETPEAVREVAAAVEEMTPALYKVYGRTKDELARQVGDAVLTKWKLGGTILAVREDVATYGTRAVEQLSAALQVSTAELHMLARFHDSFDKKRLEVWMERRMANGSPLTLTHFREVLTLDEKQQDHYLERAVQECLSHRQLAAAISETVERSQRKGRTVVAPKTPAQGIQQMESYAEHIIKRQPLWDEAVFDDLEKISSTDCTDDLLAKVAALREHQAQISLIAQGNVSRADAVIRRMQRIMGAVFTPEEESSDEEPPKFKKSPARSRAKRKARAAARKALAQA